MSTPHFHLFYILREGQPWAQRSKKSALNAHASLSFVKISLPLQRDLVSARHDAGQVKRESGENPEQTVLLCVPLQNLCKQVDLLQRATVVSVTMGRPQTRWDEPEDLPNR